MNYLTMIILYCIQQFAGERSVNAIFYLLKGKKSAQTIQDACWFQLRPLFQTFPYLTKEEFDQAIFLLKEKNYITKTENTYQISSQGIEQLKILLTEKPIPPHLNGWEFHSIDRLFWQRINLLIQTISYWIRGVNRFYPVQRNFTVQLWVKKWLRNTNTKFSKEEIASLLYSELLTLLSKLDAVNPSFFVERLSGYEKTGATAEQIAKKYQCDRFYYHLCFLHILHYMIISIRQHKEQYLLLYSIINDLYREHPLTNSTFLTYQLLQRGKTIEEIAKLRSLKKSTIEDHIVEIALMIPSFSIDKYVDIEKQKEIIHVVETLNTRKLKRIKEYVESDYFSIRLVLSRLNHLLKNNFGDVHGSN